MGRKEINIDQIKEDITDQIRKELKLELLKLIEEDPDILNPAFRHLNVISNKKGPK